ncbi:holo-ACP synthase [Hutsoniella sourekii]
MQIGTDIVEIKRIEAAWQAQAKFARRILAPEELALFESYAYPRQVTFLAGRFSAKEAYGKALKTGIGTQIRFSDVCILPDSSGAPYIHRAPISQAVALSISHSRDYATATVFINLSTEEIQAHLTHWKERNKHD